MLLHRIASTPDAVAFEYPVDHAWKTLTWRQVGERVRDIASGLGALGLTGEERCAILSSTRMEWIAADLGILCAGGATSTIYPSNTPDECAFIIQDSNTVFVFAENDDQVGKLVGKRAALGKVKKVITFDGKSGQDGWVITLAELEELGRRHHAQSPAVFEQIARAVKPEALATLIYTSGTTGRPKGVELTHDCWAYEGEAIDALDLLHADDVQYLWLPLAHSFGKVLEAAQLRIGFRTAVDGRVERLVDNLAHVRPTFVAAVPRIFEKVYNKVVGQAQHAGGLKYAIFQWAFSVGRKVSAERQAGRRAGGLSYAIADKLVFSKLKERFGGRLRFFVSGSAPLSREMAEFFHAADILILEGYGLTETSAANFVNLPHRYQFGTVGPPLPGVEVKIATEDNEILIRCRGVMRGYHNLPEATAEALDKDGWMHTGDIGELVGGMLRITDRKKDLIKTSGGKYVAPQNLEGKLKAISPVASQVLVHGNNRNFCSALVALDEEAIKAWAKENGLGRLSYAELTRHERVKELLQGHFDQLNATLASYETVKKFAILPKDLTIEDGDLTASMKIKRKVVEQKYKDLLDGFYGGATLKA
ncbi:MAG: AMP-dependent synthetase/ligase [Myxococcota bacterium]